MEEPILAIQNLEKGELEAAEKAIEDSTGRLGVIECWRLDMNAFAGTVTFIERVQTFTKLDVLAVLSAGM